MVGIIDLHIHSTASDGSFTPKDLVKYAKTKGLSTIAITDHDTVDGVGGAIEQGEIVGIEVIPGVEISVDFKTELHILGYFLEKSYLNIKHVLDCLKQSRERRNPLIVKKLNELGFDITMEEVYKEAEGSVVARPHIAKVLLKKGYVISIEEAFERYLAFGKPAYFKKEKLTPEEGIVAIRKAGGVPVLAHPIYLNMNKSELDGLIKRLKGAGLLGIEAYYVDNSEEDTKNIIELAQKNRLIVTGGSDFHGSFKPDIEIGRGRGNLCIPSSIMKSLKEAMIYAASGATKDFV